MREGMRRRLDEVCEVEYGTRVVRKRNGGSIYPVYGGGGATFQIDEFNREDRLVIARFGMSEECTRFVAGKFFLNDSGLTVSPRNGVLVQRYLDYQMLFLNDDIFGLGKGAAQKNLDVPAFRGLPLVVPTQIAEQQRLVNILDKAFQGIATAKANAERNLKNARGLFESHIEFIFSQRGDGWVEKPLSELCEIKHGFAFRSEFFTSNGDYTLLTPGNFRESGGYRDRGEKQKYYKGKIPAGFVLAEGDLLVAMTEQAAGLLGSPVLIPETGRFLHNQRLGLVTKKPGVTWMNEFFFHVFNTNAVRKAIHDGATGVKVHHTSPTKIGEVAVAFPTSLSEQERIVSALAAIKTETQRLEAINLRKLDALEALKLSLLNQAFRGAL
jgi:type I restriction enzyme S subunit